MWHWQLQQLIMARYTRTINCRPVILYRQVEVWITYEVQLDASHVQRHICNDILSSEGKCKQSRPQLRNMISRKLDTWYLMKSGFVDQCLSIAPLVTSIQPVFEHTNGCGIDNLRHLSVHCLGVCQISYCTRLSSVFRLYCIWNCEFLNKKNFIWQLVPRCDNALAEKCWSIHCSTSLYSNFVLVTSQTVCVVATFKQEGQHPPTGQRAPPISGGI